MKVISGFLKGRMILGHDIEGTRPTMDRVKESLFAMIQNYIVDSVVLDLFSGSGNLGIEAISNGSKYAYLVDKNRKCTDIIKRNITSMEIESNVRVMNCDYKKALDDFRENKVKFDIVFLDPPYKNRAIPDIIEYLLRYDLVGYDAIIVCEVSDLEVIKEFKKLEIIKNKRYGDKYIIIYKHNRLTNSEFTY